MLRGQLMAQLLEYAEFRDNGCIALHYFLSDWYRQHSDKIAQLSVFYHFNIKRWNLNTLTKVCLSSFCIIWSLSPSCEHPQQIFIVDWFLRLKIEAFFTCCFSLWVITQSSHQILKFQLKYLGFADRIG